MNCLVRLLFVLLSLPLCLAAQDSGTVTLLDGALRVIRAVTVFDGSEGMRLHSGDIIESSDAGFAQLELAGGTIVALGPSTSLLFSRAKGTAADLFLLDGWLKAESGSNAGDSRYATPLLGAMTRNGTLVWHATTAGTELFVESGAANLGEANPNGTWGRSRSAKAGEFFTRRNGKNVTTASRPDSTFLESMPRPFRDTLPSRLSRFAGRRAPEPRRNHEVTYSEIQPWLAIAPSWRKGFVERFQPRLKDVEFRRSVEAQLNQHPEWEPVLHPEKHPASSEPAADDAKSPDGRYSR